MQSYSSRNQENKYRAGNEHKVPFNCHNVIRLIITQVYKILQFQMASCNLFWDLHAEPTNINTLMYRKA